MQPHGKFETGVDAGRNDAVLKLAEPARVRVRSLAARGLAAVLITLAALFALPLQAQAQTMVPHDWSLKPSGLGTGDQFRLIFLSSSTRDASSNDIEVYNTFIQNGAATGHADIRTYSSSFKVVGCTSSVDARDNTGTTGTGVPIYWLGGSQVADNYADFYDGSWDDEVNDKNEDGTNGPNTSHAHNYPWTGCDHDGTLYVTSGVVTAGLGNDAIAHGRPNSINSAHGPMYGGASLRDDLRPMYGLSPVFQVEPLRVRFGSSSYTAIEGGADAVVTVELSARSSQALTIRLTENRQGGASTADYSGVPTSVTFAIGETEKTFDVTAVADSANDTGESVKLGFDTLPSGVVAGSPSTTTVALGHASDVPWHGETLKDATKKLGARRIANSGDVVWYSLPNLRENGVYQLSGYFQYAQDPVSRPKLQIYRPNGDPVVHHGHEIAATGANPNLRFMPDAAGTYYMKVSSLDNDTGKFSIHYADYSLSRSGAGDRNGTDCSGALNTRCGIPAPGHAIEGKLAWNDADRYDFALRKGGKARVCVEFFRGSAPVNNGYSQYGVSSPTSKWSWLFSREAGTFCTEGFTPNYTGIYEVVVLSMIGGGSKPGGNQDRNYEVRYELAPFAATANATGTDPVTPTEPLTATLEDIPTNHDGSSAFTFRIAFSADVEITPEDMRDHALTVAGGTVTAATRVDGRSDLWELTVEPAGTAAVTILAPLDRACTETGALCTADGQALSTGLGHSVPGPAPQGQQAQQAPEPLAAGFVSVPAEHDGETEFWLELSFDAAVVEGSKRHIRALLGVTGGSETRIRQKDGRLDHWRVRIEPSSHEAVTVTLSPSPPCGAAGAVCTEDGRTYTTALATRINGPVGISVADATVQEGAGAQLDFVVSLSRAATSTVTVDYLTRNGTAIAGQDYTATSGTLTFAAGETTGTVAVPVLDDAHDEGSETMKLKLSNASGARITDRKAIGIITNSGPLQRAWLSRFGRTVAEQVLDAVGARVEGNSNSPGPAQLTLGGHRVVLGASWSGAEDTLLGEAGVLGQDLRETRDLFRAEADASPAREVSTAGLLMASSFHMASAGGEGEDDARWSLWARGSRSSFSGREDALTLEGDVSTGVMGADYERGRVLAGVALAYSAGEGSYTEADARGEVESTLLSAYPYLRYTLSERLSVWGVLGLGEGGLTLDMKANENANDEHIETDVSLAMAAFGARGKLASVAGYDLAVKTDVLFVRTESEAVTGLVAADARTRRLRLALEGSREVKFESGVLTPSLEIGLRHDGGDAETGSGLELGGGLRWAGLKGFSVEVRARGLLAHEESDYEEWGVSASIGLSPGEGDRGFSMRVGSAWGAAAGGVERLWSQRALAGSSFDPDARLDAEVGYGLDAMRGLLTPYTGVALSSGGETWRAGARFRLSSALEVSLEASLTEPAGDGEPASGLVLRGTKRW